jgi:Lon protease-like protein
VLFPNVFLPLHIFEPRYRAMVADVMDRDRMIGMVLLKPGHDAMYEGRPPIFTVGCAGVVTHLEPLSDGRYNLVLRGVERFRIDGEEPPDRAYRVARLTALPEVIAEEHRAELRRHRHHIEALLAAAQERAGTEPRFPPAMPDEDLVNALAQHLDLEPMERQALLERDGVLERCRALIDLLEMRTRAPNAPWTGGGVH